jgi:hypothetical protein
MKTIAELEHEIRDFINNPRKQYGLFQRAAAWNMLCSCLDFIGDIELAIAAYDRVSEPEEDGAKYLFVYGILQTLFLQQDAVCNLCEALELDYRPDPTLEKIREIRNDSIGHPTKRGGGQGRAFNFVSRSSLSKSGFELMTRYPDRQPPRFQNINIPSLIEAQQGILEKVLTEVLEKLKEEEVDHRAMFKSERLQDSFPSVLHYYFEKLYESIHGSKPVEFGSMHVKLIAEAVESFKNQMDNRGILKVYDSVTYSLDLLEYPIEQLSLYFTDQRSSSLNNKSAYVFAFFVEKHIDDLKSIAEELDKKYESEPEKPHNRQMQPIADKSGSG